MLQNRQLEIIDTQDNVPKIKECLDKVGIEGIRAHLKIIRQNIEYSHLPIIDMNIDLPDNKKGAHMSRLPETINEVISRKTEGIKESLEEFGNEVLEEIQKKHSYQRAELTIKTTLILDKLTPVTHKKSIEPYDILTKVIKNNGTTLKYLEVKVIGNTLCPHCLKVTGDKTHIQRADLQLGILTDLKTDISYEEMIKLCEDCFSSPTYTVLKTEDEKFVVEQMFRNPKFVEDLTRECFNKTKNLGIKAEVSVRAVSYESIHKHNVISEIKRQINGECHV
jgi:GTP cyclohydrolase IV